MMLTKAQKFDQIIQNPTGAGGRGGKNFVTWEDPIQIENYTKQV
jgi:hypothetical protein